MNGSSEFQLFGPDHVAVISFTVAAASILVLSKARLRTLNDGIFRIGLAVLFLMIKGSGWLYAASAEGRMEVPFHLCDVALVITIWALLTLQPAACQLAYFWGLAGSLQAVLTPDLAEPFPEYWWFQFFIIHNGIMLTVIYLAVTGRVQPTLRTVGWVWLISNLYVVAAGLANWWFGTNYGYLAEKPGHPSLLDYFGPWPYYILGIEIGAAVSFLICYAPFAIARRYPTSKSAVQAR